MNKIGKKFVALLVAFFSVMSFIPIQMKISEKPANAATAMNFNIPDEYLQVQVSSEGKFLPEGIDDLTSYPYFDSSQGSDTFDISIKQYNEDIEKKLEDIKKNATESTEGYFYSIEDTDLIITGLNNIDLTNGTGIAALQELTGIQDPIVDIPAGVIQGRKGQRIVQTPYGVDKVQYRIEGTVIKTTYKVTVSEDGKTKTIQRVGADEELTEKYIAANEKNIIINNGTDFVGDNVELVFDQYIGTGNAKEDELNDILDADTTKENNKAPFLYTAKAESDEKVKLRYTWGVPDSLSALYYNMKFKGVTLNTGNTIVYVNGVKGNAKNTTDDTIRGYLGNMSSMDQFVVIKINGTSPDDTSLAKLYSAELRYSKKNRENDYSIQSAGINKADYSDDSSVKAYIGKRFTQTEVDDGEGGTYTEYTGTIIIDPKARMINLEPLLVRNSSSTKYILWNNYVQNGVKKSIKAYELINGKAYIDFRLGEQNELELQVYDSSSDKLLAKYKLTVVEREDAETSFDVNFIFDDNNAETFLTREGVAKKKDEAKEKAITFKEGLSYNRSTFDLYTKDENEVKISLDSDGRTNSNEYFKAWISSDADGSNFTEAEDSVNNVFVENSERSTDLYINLNNVKRIKVQAYYDEVDENTGKLIGSYPLGGSYIFFLRENIKSTDNTNGKSDNANLSNIKVKGQTLENLDTDGKGFSSDSYNYRVTVPKDQESAVITIEPEDENVKSISAAVSGTDLVYDIAPGEETELMLNSSGITDLEITVTAQDGKTTKIYTLSIINSKKGQSSKLKNLILSSGEFDFDPDEYTVKVNVDQSTNKVSITPVPEDAKAKVTVDGQKFKGTPVNVSLTGKQTVEVDIQVESEDGNNTSTYTLRIKRTSSFDEEDDSSQGITDDVFYDYDNRCWVDTTKYDEWGVVNNRVAYFDKRGRQVKDRWIETGHKWYYINEAGYRATGWKIDAETGQKYYLDDKTGEMKTGFINLNGSWYYLGTNGVMHTGWLWIKPNWYYFTENGEMITNQTMFVDDKMYRFASDGRIY